MNQHVYDRDQAQKLTTLLRAIAREIRERSADIDRLERVLDAQRGPGGDRDAERQRSLLSLRLVEHRHALLAAERELTRLGCRIDDDHPLRVLIPGAEDDSGFAYDVLSGELEALPAHYAS
jgi:hypothetical protein